jgi:hypothetical protein
MSDTPVEQAQPVAAPAPAASAPVATPAPAAQAPTAAPSAGSSAPAAAAPQFAWNSWEGKVDSLPEGYRDVASNVLDWGSKDRESKDEEISNLRSMYSALLVGDEDPRIEQFGGEIEELKKLLEEKDTTFSGLQEKYDALTNSSVQDYVDRFWKEHQELASDEEKLQVFSKFLDPANEYGGAWDGYIAAELMGLPDEAIQLAVEAKKEGVSDKYALKLAKAHNEVQEYKGRPSKTEMAEKVASAKAEEEAKKPRPAAKLTNGATGAARPTVAKKTLSDAKSFDEMRTLAAARALRVHKGGRK